MAGSIELRLTPPHTLMRRLSAPPFLLLFPAVTIVAGISFFRSTTQLT